MKVGYLYYTHHSEMGYLYTDTHIILKLNLYVFQLVLVGVFQFTLTQYTSEEGGAALQVCMLLLFSSLGNVDVTIDVTNVGGTATPGKLH